MARRNRVLKTLWLPIAIGLGSLTGIVAPAHSYEPLTHLELSAAAVDRSSLDVILRTQYGLAAGADAVVGNTNTLLQSVRQWIAYGGFREDSPPYRALNHFHNPTVPWAQAGVGIGRSSIRWQQDPAQGFLFGGTWSWPEARDRFRDFLTLNDPDARSEALANAGRALGQVMHMIQDATSPPHTREDPHLLHDGYEARIDELRGADQGSERRLRFERLLSPSLFVALPSSAIFTLTPDDLAPDPIARLIDTDTYQKTLQTYTTGNLIGAAEYTNGGYLSDDTIFRDFSLPRVESLGDAVQEGGRTYFPRNTEGDRIAHFVARGALFRPLLFRGQRLGGYMLDDRVYEDYAEQLVPRAVSYSAGLLNYFFRSNFSFTVDPGPNDPAQRLLRVQIPALLDAETMDGTFTLYADDRDGRRSAVSGASITISLPRGASVDALFTPPSGVRAYVLVFDGALGIEPRAVTGIVKPVGPFVFVIQETAELTGAESLTTVVDVDNAASYQTTDRRSKDERTQRATGRFFSPSTTDPGKQLKRVALEFDPRAVILGDVHLLLDDVDFDREWRRETSSIDNPRRWEIRFDVPAFYGGLFSGVLVPNVPRFVVTETMDGVKTKTPLVWWRKISTLGAATGLAQNIGFACPPELGCEIVQTNSTLTQGLVFFGDGDGEGRDRTPTGQRSPFTAAHTSVSFIPTGSVAGYDVGTIDQHGSLNCFTGCVSAASCSTGTINLFAGQAAQGPVWMKDEFSISLGDLSGLHVPATIDACVRPTPAPPPAPDLPQLTFKRDYLAADQSRFQEFGVTPPAYEIMLK